MDENKKKINSGMLSLIDSCERRHKERLTQAENAPNSRGASLYVKYLKGNKLTPQQSIVAQCCHCSGFFWDGRVDCENPLCPLYSYMPYRASRKKRGATHENQP